MVQAWFGMWSILVEDEDLHDCLEILPALATATKQNLQGSNNCLVQLWHLPLYLASILDKLQDHDGLDGNILSAVESLIDDLERMLHLNVNTQSTTW